MHTICTVGVYYKNFMQKRGNIVTVSVRNDDPEGYHIFRFQGAIPKDVDFRDNQSIELSSSLMAALSADIILYPLETILHR